MKIALKKALAQPVENSVIHNFLVDFESLSVRSHYIFNLFCVICIGDETG
jgi:hypothetical protein